MISWKIYDKTSIKNHSLIEMLKIQGLFITDHTISWNQNWGKALEETKSTTGAGSKLAGSPVKLDLKELRRRVKQKGTIPFPCIRIIEGAVAVEVCQGEGVIVDAKNLRVGIPENVASVSRDSGQKGGLLTLE